MKKFTILVVIAAVLTIIIPIGLSLGFLNATKYFLGARYFMCEGKSLILYNKNGVYGVAYRGDVIGPCEKRNEYILCRMPSEDVDSGLNLYIGFLETNKKLFKFINLKPEQVESEKIREVLKDYGREKLLEVLCDLYKGRMDKELGMCMWQSYKCEEI